MNSLSYQPMAAHSSPRNPDLWDNETAVRYSAPANSTTHLWGDHAVLPKTPSKAEGVPLCVADGVANRARSCSGPLGKLCLKPTPSPCPTSEPVVPLSPRHLRQLNPRGRVVGISDFYYCGPQAAFWERMLAVADPTSRWRGTDSCPLF